MNSGRRGEEQKQTGSLGRFILTEVGAEISGNTWKVAADPIPGPPKAARR